jgi:hypothetical protein
MKLADWKGFEKRREGAAMRGTLRGIGISNTIEFAADPTIETAEIRFARIATSGFRTALSTAFSLCIVTGNIGPINREKIRKSREILEGRPMSL